MKMTRNRSGCCSRSRPLGRLAGLGLGLIWLLVLIVVPSSQAQDSGRRQVLILHSYHIGYKWTDDVNAGILAGLQAQADNLDVQIEYMDTKRIFDEVYRAQLYETYKHKFRDRSFDVIISSDDNAFNFLRDHRDEIFPGTPVVFSGVNYFRESAVEGFDLYTGVNEEADIRSGLSLAFDLHPEVRTVAIVNDTTTTGQKVHEEIVALLPDYQDRAEFLLLEDVDMAEVQAAVAALPPDSFVFYTLFLRDASGRFYEFDESIQAVVEASAVPVYGTWDFSLGYGIVGGMLTSGYSQGEAAARLALQVLDGQDVDEIPVVMESPNRYLFDYEVLQRYGIPLAALPEDSAFVNRPVSLVTEFRGWFVGGGVAIAALVLIILILISINLRRRRAEEALRISNRELAEVQSSLEQRVQERTAALDRRSSQLTAAAQVARGAAAIRNLGELLDETVHLTSELMDYYHAGIYLLDEEGAHVVLRAASGMGGQRMLEQGFKLEMGGESLIGSVAASGSPQVEADVAKAHTFFDHPELPDTHSEAALPLKIRGRVVGVLDVQSAERDAFSEEDVAILEVLADQVSLAIDNARLFGETQDRLREIAVLAGERAQAAWQRIAAERQEWGYVYDGVEAVPRDMVSRTHVEPEVCVPLEVQEQTIGQLGLALEGRSLTAEDVELIEAIAGRASQALERARLFQESRRRASREQLVREIAERIRTAISVEDAVQRTIQEMGRVLGASEVVARIGSEQDLLADGGGNGNE